MNKVYRYGLRSPIVNGDQVREQLRKAHRYYNTLIEIERDRRSAYRELRRLHCPEIEMFEAWEAQASAEVEAALQVIKSARKTTRSRSETIEQRDEVTSIRERRYEVAALAKAAREAAKTNVALITDTAKLDEATNAAKKTARAACGCYWGTYLLIEAAVEQACKTARGDLAFKRWTGCGNVGVQLQGGLTEAGLLEDTRLQIVVPPSQAWRKVPGHRQMQRTIVRLRIGSDGRDPVWAEWPLLMHRPLPTDAVISWAKVKLEILGGQERWSLHLTVRTDEIKATPETRAGAIACDVGWRKRKDGLRIAWLYGEGGFTQEVQIDPTVLNSLKQVDDLQAIRDMHLNGMRETFVTWLHETKVLLPDWLAEEIKTVHSWRSAARYARLIVSWRDRRFVGDEIIYPLLETWRKKDKHLWTWECNLRDKVLHRRRDGYRVLAAKLADRYKTLVLEKFDLRRMQRHAALETAEVENATARVQQRWACISEYRVCLIQAFAARGGEVIELPAFNTTRECHHCGAVETWDQATELEHRCSKCGTLWDQDENAGKILFDRYREWLGDATKHPAADRKDLGVKEPRWSRRGRHRLHCSQTTPQPHDNIA